MTTRLLTSLLLLVLLAISACSPGSAFTQSGGLGTLFGGAAGAGIGAALGKQHGETQMGAVLGGAIGAGLGLVTGAIIHEQNEQMTRQEEIVIRQAAVVSPEQREIDALRKDINESTDWGRSEVKPWDERYQGTNSNSPYQGPASAAFRN